MTYLAPEEYKFGIGFLERLETNAKAISFVQGPSASEVLDSIKCNVASILNSRIGGAQSAPSLGLIDFNDATLESMDISVRIKLAIQNCLERYEPRLNNILVSAERDAYDLMALRFCITASIDRAAIHESVRFSLLLDSNRKYRVF